MTNLIALTGYARAGKDVLANHLIKSGYERLNFGDVIKGFFDDFTERRISLEELEVKISESLYSEKSEADLQHFMATIAKRFWNSGVTCSAFTEDDSKKAVIRPILERGGELIYGYCLDEYEAQVKLALALGRKIVNTRVCMPDGEEEGEVYLLKRLGFMIVEVRRKDWPAASEWETQGVERMKAHGLIDLTVMNDASDAQGWEFKSRNYANVLVDSAREHESEAEMAY